MLRNCKLWLPAILSAGLMLVANYSQAQVSVGGTPLSWTSVVTASNTAIVLPVVDEAALLLEDEARLMNGEKTTRFGYNHDVTIDVLASCEWETTSTHEIGRLAIQSEGARSLNLIFSDFYLEQEVSLFLYNESKNDVIGAFTSANNKSYRTFSTLPLPGDVLVLEINAPLGSRTELTAMQLETVTHAYKDLFTQSLDKGLGQSGSCNVNVNCPEAAGWEDQRRSVARIVVNGNDHCTGALINNTENDGTPYFLTANHCLTGNVTNWVFWFNWESPTCNPTQNSSYDGISGSTLLASCSSSDFALLELSQEVPLDYNPYYAGWSAENTAPTSAVGIHHPSGDIKKWSYDGDASVSSEWGGWGSSGTNTHWEVLDWDIGTTEGGSSGSPLFDQNQRIVGQLHGGAALCGNDFSDLYGKVAYSWDCQNQNSGRLDVWLDPSNTGLTLLDGFDPNSDVYANDAMAGEILGFEDSCASGAIAQLVLVNAGADPLTSTDILFGLNGSAQQTINWTGYLAPGSSEIVDLELVSLSPGPILYQARVSNPNGVTDENSANNLAFVNKTILGPAGCNPTSVLSLDAGGLLLAPNPVDQVVSLSRVDNEHSIVRIVNSTGQLMVQKDWMGNTLSLDVSQWSDGVYVVHSQSITTGKEGRVSFVKQ
ncbi:MAG: trypsin-like peptidase domain-containing protein [Chitinophagales bacterium]